MCLITLKNGQKVDLCMHEIVSRGENIVDRIIGV